VSIEARVATVLSKREVAFNVGTDRGVQEDDLATVIRMLEVTDPESEGSLGFVRRRSCA
jgi:hypothetical protein